jgi:hypothetical protein
MSAAVLIEAVEVEDFGAGGVVAPAFGDVQGVESHHGTVQVPRFQELGQMAGLVVLDFSPVAGYWPMTGSHGARRRARSAWLARLVHCPTAVSATMGGMFATVNGQAQSGDRRRAARAHAREANRINCPHIIKPGNSGLPRLSRQFSCSIFR